MSNYIKEKLYIGVKFLTNRENIYFMAICLSFLIWIITIAFEGKDSSQLSVFFNRMDNFLADFTNTVGYSALRNPYNNLAYRGWEHKQYPPLAYVFFYICSKFSFNIDTYYEENFFLNMYKEPFFMFVLILFYSITSIIVFELVVSNKNGSLFKKYGTALAVLLSYPVLFTIERGNNYIMASIFVMIFVFYYDSTNKLLKEFALISLGVAFGLKLTPAIFGMLLLIDKKWFEAIRTGIYGLLSFFPPMLIFEGGAKNFFYFIRNLKISAESHSAFSGVSILGSISYVVQNIFARDIPGTRIESILILLNYICLLLLLIFCIFYKDKWLRVLALSIVAISASGQAGEYSLLIYFPFIILFLNEKSDRINGVNVLVMVAILMMMCTYVSGFWIWDIHIGVLIMCLICGIIGVKDTYIYLKSKREKL